MPTAPGVSALGWVKCREHISLLVILCIIMYVTKNNNNNNFTKPISDYGNMFKYQEKYRYTDMSVELYFCINCQIFGPHKNNNNINNNNNNFQIHKT